VRGVLLDVDGTLLLSNRAHAETWAAALAEAGYDVPAERVLRMVGMGGDKMLPQLIGVETDSPEGERLVARKKALFTERLHAVRPAPGARALLERLRAEGRVLVVATSAEEDELRGLLRQAGIEDLIDERTTSSDVERSKPDPDIVAAAVRRSGHPPEALVMLGDTPYDVEAALGAGVALVGVRCGGWDDAALAGAVAVYDDPAHLLRELDGSPLGGARGGA
jgi:HAD superfamily hydrolase (TIGR01509 family)